MEIIATLDTLTERGSKLSGTHSHEATGLLIRLFDETKDAHKVADYLMRFKSSVCQSFFEQSIAKFESGEIESLYNAMRSTDAYKKNLNHVGTTRGFIISAVLLKAEIDIGRTIFIQTLADVEKNGSFSPAVIDCFKKYTIPYCGIPAVEAISTTLEGSRASRNRYIRFMQAFKESIIISIKLETTTEMVSTTAPDVSTAPKGEDNTSGTEAAPNKHQATPKSDKTAADNLVTTLAVATGELNKLLGTMRESYGTITTLIHTIAERNSQINSLHTELSNRDRQISSLQDAVRKCEAAIAVEKAEVSDLTERLKTSLQMDTITQSQELLTLKTNLANSLKVEYDDFLNSKESECNADTFGALRGSLSRIFKLLRRHGISIE